MKPITLILSLFLFALGSLSGQDIHFSQYYNSPLTLNPALTGYFDGNYRVGANFRRQWAGIDPNTPFTTIGAFYDMPVPSQVYEDYLDQGKFSTGLQFYADRAGIGQLTNKTILLSTAYQREIGQEGRHNASAGLQLGYVRKSVNFRRLTFRQQVRGDVIDPSIPSGEPASSNVISYLDLRVGILWSSIINEDLDITGGLSAYHLTFPQESFTGQNNRLPPRFTLHGSARYALTDKMNLHPSILIMQQTTAHQANLGTSVSYPFQQGGETITMFGGMWFRISAINPIVDAGIPTIGFKYKNLQGGLSYDLNISSLRQASNYRGGPEISIIYIPQFQQKLPVKKQLPCIRF